MINGPWHIRYVGLLIDVVVHPDYQGNGYGKLLIESLLNFIKGNIDDNKEIMVLLLSAPGKQTFYSKFGFKVKHEVVEDGMYMWVKK